MRELQFATMHAKRTLGAAAQSHDDENMSIHLSVLLSVIPMDASLVPEMLGKEIDTCVG